MKLLLSLAMFELSGQMQQMGEAAVARYAGADAVLPVAHVVKLDGESLSSFEVAARDLELNHYFCRERCSFSLKDYNVVIRATRDYTWIDFALRRQVRGKMESNVSYCIGKNERISCRMQSQ